MTNLADSSHARIVGLATEVGRLQSELTKEVENVLSNVEGRHNKDRSICWTIAEITIRVKEEAMSPITPAGFNAVVQKSTFLPSFLPNFRVKRTMSLFEL